MRIAIIADALDQQYAGVHTYTREVIAALCRVDEENEYLIVREKAGEPLEGVKEIVVPSRGIPAYSAYRLLFAVPSLLADRKVDIVVEPRHFGPWNLPAQMKRVTVIHDLTPILFPHQHRFASQVLQRLFLPRILKKADLIITNSRYTAQDVATHFPFAAEKIEPVLLGRDESLAPREDREVLSRYGINRPYLLFVGTLEPRKNIATLVEAFEIFRQNSPEPYQLVIVGKRGWKYSQLLDRIACSAFAEDIILTGYVPRADLAPLYTMTSAFVFPSLYEGFGLPVLEAMSCGAPVLSSATSSLPEIGGEAALYFEPEDTRGLARLIFRITTDGKLRRRYQRLSLERAESFSWISTAQRMIELFEQLGSSK